MKKLFCAAILVVSLVPAVFSQSGNASLGGTVRDGSGALIPGVEIKATNIETGVVSTGLSNETGTYNILSLLPGLYTVNASLPGFRAHTVTDVRLGTAGQVRLNFTMEIAALATEVEVSTSAQQLLLEASSSVGGVLDRTTVESLPVISATGADAIDLVRTMPGVRMTRDPIFGGNSSTLAGVSAANVQIQRDGVEAGGGGRWPVGLIGATIVNPDMVGEVRTILSPVDAEIGRGNAQVQIQTRSGTNEFRGAAVWNVRNTALEPNSWVNNRTQPTPVPAPWFNDHQYTLSLGGPIRRNKTHFFTLWDSLLPNSRTDVNNTVLTPCAANGIFRYYDNWNNGNVRQVTSLGSTPTMAVVDFLGNPAAPQTNPNGTSHNGVLRYASVFGPLQNIPARPDCSDAIVQDAPWDPFRTQVDTTGYVRKVLTQAMPEVNNYEIGDGLNTAGHRFLRGQTGIMNRYGHFSANRRKQINVKLDHNFNPSHKAGWGYTYEDNYSDYSLPLWPYGFPGGAVRTPQVMTANLTSTLRANLLNEVRLGMRRTGTNTYHAFSERAEPEVREAALNWYPEVSEIPVFLQPGTNPICFCGGQPGGHTATGGAFNADVRESTRAYTLADTISWIKSKHAFKIGGEYRHERTALGIDVVGNDWSTYARAFGGETTLTPVQGITSANIPGLAGTATTGNNLAMRGLLNLLSGSVSRVTQLYWLGSADSLEKWDDYRNDHLRSRELRQNAFSFFFKDDWKATPELTLNLGIRWDYYGVPWVDGGLTPILAGGGNALFGYSGRGFGDWMQPGQRGELTELVLGGPGSPNPELRPWPRDLNNFGPAIGFAWQIPWFGAGQATVRGGYQLTYMTQALGGLDGALANPPGSSWQGVFDGGPGDLSYLDLTDLRNIIPNPPPVSPMLPIPVTARNVPLSAFDPSYQAPYIQNLTLALTRNLSRSLTLDVRYVGTLSRKLYSSMDINAPTLFQNGLKDAFDAARTGGESALLDEMFRGVNVAGTGYGPVGTVFNGVTQTGAMHLRAVTAGNVRTNLANGNYVAVANTLSTLNYAKVGGRNAGLPDIPAGVNGAILRYTGFPENFIKTNKQLSTATLQNNMGNAHYHSLQTQMTLRPAAALSVQVSHTWSRSLGNVGPYTTPFDRSGDYRLQAGHRLHDFRTHGTFKLPFGPQQLFLSNSSGILARFVEGWDLSWLFSAATGAPASIVAQNMLYGNGVPDVAGPFDVSAGKVRWQDGANFGTYFGEGYSQVRDPQCSAIAQSLRSICTLNAIADSSGRIVLQHPQPGTRGNLGLNVVEGPGEWKFDTSIGKRFQVRERLSMQLRLDAVNIFNHPMPDDPVLNINNVNFGNILQKGTLLTGGATQFAGDGKRLFKLQMRLEF